MERAHLVRFERTDDGMEHATVMEQHEILFLPVMWVDQLSRQHQHQAEREERIKEKGTHARRNGGTLHFVQQVAYLLEIREVRAIGVQRVIA